MDFNSSEININCTYFAGEKPCKFKRACKECSFYTPADFKILIIKLAAMGDVIRTTPLLYGIKRLYQRSHITWITDISSVDVLKNNPLIDKVLSYDMGNILRLQIEEFNVLYSLDKEIRATALAEMVKATEKKGFSFHKKGNIYPLNEEALYAFRLGIDDDLKFNINQKTYQEIIFELCNIPYEKDEYIFRLLPEEIEEGKRYFNELGIHDDNTIIGLNTGSGPIYATKKWSEEGFIELAHKLHNTIDNIKIVLLGGPDEIERHRIIKEKAPVIDTGHNNSLRRFASIVNNCHLLVTGDTLAMHLAIAQKIPVVTFFGPTCPQEIELYGRGKKIIANHDCLPCYKCKCKSEVSCLYKMSSDEVYNSVTELLSDTGIR
ncbi:MAG: glycosyltransferase family 9 protein [Candidatus Eremiobacterota bacterium]